MSDNITTINQLFAEILRVLPNATFDEDNDGQIIIYTNLRETDEGVVEL